MSEKRSARKPRRNWPKSLKRQIVEESNTLGISVCEVARGYDLDPAQLFSWRKKFGMSVDKSAASKEDTAFIAVELDACVDSKGDKDVSEQPSAERFEIAFSQWPPFVRTCWRRARFAGRADRCCRRMISLPTGTKVWLAAGKTDMRKGFDGLSAVAQRVLNANPLSGHVFVFRGRMGDRVKCPSSNNMRPLSVFSNGVSGSSVVSI